MADGVIPPTVPLVRIKPPCARAPSPPQGKQGPSAPPTDPALQGVLGEPDVDVRTSRAGTDWARLVEDHHALLYRYALRLAGHGAWAEDLVQETFLQAFRFINQLQDPERISRWLMAILRNTYLKDVRRKRPEQATSWDFSLEASCPDPSPCFVEEADRGEQLEILLCKLPTEFREVLLLYYFEEIPYEQISQLLDLPLGTVMSRLHRAKTKLKDLLDAEEAAHVTPSRSAAKGVAP